jgi:hypothetical protein
MTTLAHDGPRAVIGGVDTHKDPHVAAVIDDLGRILGVQTFPATRRGYCRLLGWLQSHGELSAVGVEGCGSWGAGLARFLSANGVRVVGWVAVIALPGAAHVGRSVGSEPGFDRRRSSPFRGRAVLTRSTGRS